MLVLVLLVPVILIAPLSLADELFALKPLQHYTDCSVVAVTIVFDIGFGGR